MSDEPSLRDPVADELSESLMKALERVPDRWSNWTISGQEQLALHDLGLIEWRSSDRAPFRHVRHLGSQGRRTDLGRAMLISRTDWRLVVMEDLASDEPPQWLSPCLVFVQSSQTMHVAHYEFNFGEWLTRDAGLGHSSLFGAPTHWRPLPDPPSNRKDGSSKPNKAGA